MLESIRMTLKRCSQQIWDFNSIYNPLFYSQVAASFVPKEKKKDVIQFQFNGAACIPCQTLSLASSPFHKISYMEF